MLVSNQKHFDIKALSLRKKLLFELTYTYAVLDANLKMCVNSWIPLFAVIFKSEVFLV